jgi:hypothetical protein
MKEHDFLTNLAILEEKMRRETINNLIFAPFIGTMEAERLDNGQIDYKPSGNVVEMLKWEANADHILMPMEKNLVGSPKYGDVDLVGSGEEMDYRWLKGFINQTSHVVNQKAGNMDKLRDDRVLKKYSRAATALRNWFSVMGNAHFISAIYEGHSSNITEPVTTAPNGIGAKVKYHPNMYYNTQNVGTAATGGISAVGTEFYNKTAAEVLDRAYTGGASLTLPGVYMLEKLGVLCENLRIVRAAEYKGSKYWLTVISKEDLNNLKQDSLFRTSVQNAYMGKETANPLFSNEVYIFAEFMFLIDRNATRKWNNTTGDFAGSNGYRGAPTYLTHNNNVWTVMGKGALGYAKDAGNDLHFETEKSNFSQVMEIAGMQIDGINRADFVTEATNAAYFATKQTTKTVMTAQEVHNDSSMQLIVGA